MTENVKRYFTARQTVAPTLSPDGDLAFLADTTGTAQVWTTDGAGAWPRQRTFYDERVSFVSWSPAGGAVVFGKDAGADEHDQLFRLDPATNAVEQLTDDPDAIHSWGAWHPDGDRIAFAANREDAARFDVYAMDADGGDPELLAESDEEGFLEVEAWDGDRLVVRRSRASSDDDLFVVDGETGERRRVTPHDGHVRYRQPVFGPDGDALYCLSDANADAKELVRIDLDSLTAETVVSGGEWSIDRFALDADSGRLALTRNVDGYAELRVGRLTDAADATLADADVPEGVVHDLTVGPAGERVAATVSAPDLNHSVFVADLSAGGASEDGPVPTERWTRPSPGGVELDAYAAPDLVRYETFDDRQIPAYFTLPDGVDGGSATDEVPVVVDIHGGPHHQRRPWFRPIRQYLLDAGYAVFEPNVRGSSGYGKEYAALDDVEKRMDSVRDIAEAVEWLRDRPEIDPDGVVAYGRSYGGFMVLAAVTEFPDLWAAAVDFVGIANWETFLENTGDWRRSHREAEYGSLADDREFLESISPIHSADEIRCPLFVQHGANDPRVPVGEARQIAEEVREQGVPVETLIFEDEGHHTTKLDNRIEMFERIAAFLDEHVR
ncbi:S9 family peptidase [Halorussus gelatinilyticus]|uniref:Acyl-peptide hydrolase n=1 Tax=Halorussus gelatinilyticus TaxID=2937524 RepID=A0A8U0IIF0_9EURY|nr:S9 family peptidase [Halorussus gelatinilyticus]UPW00054.1 S9 family peptidase [Halorussus gelatinilyticus]